MRRLALVAIIASALCASCAAPPVATEFEDSTTFAHSFDDVWTAAMEVFADNMWAIDTLEKDSGLITTDWLELNVRGKEIYADCGKDMAGTVNMPGYVKFNVFVKRAGPDVMVRVNCHFKPLIETAGFGEKKTCLSKGHLEARIFADLNEKLP